MFADGRWLCEMPLVGTAWQSAVVFSDRARLAGRGRGRGHAGGACHIRASIHAGETGRVQVVRPCHMHMARRRRAAADRMNKNALAVQWRAVRWIGGCMVEPGM